jgi:hypothetical protein
MTEELVQASIAEAKVRACHVLITGEDLQPFAMKVKAEAETARFLAASMSDAKVIYNSMAISWVVTFTYHSFDSLEKS